ncbi:MAG: HAMP domain-containing protein [Chloroflexi bacterium]|nr:HAMP domain-containing protein [Chloroflexota bacterium]
MKAWRDLPLHWRLSLMYVGLMALLLTALGFAFSWETERFLLETTTSRLRAQAKPVIARWTNALPTPLTQEGLAATAQHLAQDLTSKDTAALILDAQGQPLATGRRLPEEPPSPPPDPQAVARALQGENEVDLITTFNGQRTLVVLIPWRRAPGSAEILGVIQLSTSLAGLQKVLWHQRLWLILGGAAVLLLGALGSLWMTHAALQPLRQMASTCQRIAQGDLSQRLNLPQQNDEIGQLAQAFDHMVAQLEASFAAQRRFVANAAHELRTPLTAIQGSLEVLLRGAQDDPAAAARLTQSMYREVTRLTRLSEQLLDLTRVETTTALHKQPVALDAFFQEFLPQAQLLAHNRTVRLEPGPAITVEADADALKEILFNLVDNAVQHTAEGGHITLGWQATDNQVHLWVADDGEGIAPEDLPHIFEPFYRGDTSRSRRWGGTGLGLALVKTLVEAHGGQVVVSSQPGQGARFTVILPR